MFEFFTDKIADQTARAVKSALTPVGPYLRMLGTGLVLMLISVIFWGLAGLFLALCLFLAFSHLPYALAALYVFLISAGLGLIVLLFGLRMLRKPR